MVLFTFVLRLLEGHFKGVPIPPPKYPPSHPTNFTPKRSLRGMRFLRYESLCDVRLRGYWWLPLQPLFCIRAALDLSTSLRSRWQGAGRMVVPLVVISTGENLWFSEWRNLFQSFIVFVCHLMYHSLSVLSMSYCKFIDYLLFFYKL